MVFDKETSNKESSGSLSSRKLDSTKGRLRDAEEGAFGWPVLERKKEKWKTNQSNVPNPDIPDLFSHLSDEFL